jgi:hypothetical protein
MAAHTLPANERAGWSCLVRGGIIGDGNCGWRRVLRVLEGWCVSGCGWVRWEGGGWGGCGGEEEGADAVIGRGRVWLGVVGGEEGAGAGAGEGWMW